MTIQILPRSLIGILGPPRSGTTLIANAMIAHSQATGIIEPYQVRRNVNYHEADPAALIRDFKISTDMAPHVFVKETTTRVLNVTTTLDLLQGAREKGIYTGLVVILRRPLDAYLSQIEASRMLWRQKLMTEISETTFDAFAIGIQRGLFQICRRARTQHYRLISYERFCSKPKTELARLMALVPLCLEASQLLFKPPGKIAVGGDPKTKLKAGGIAPACREEDVAFLRKRFAGRATLRFFDELEAFVLDRVGVVPDRILLDELTLLLLRRWAG